MKKNIHKCVVFGRCCVTRNYTNDVEAATSSRMNEQEK